jgi:peptidoglycan/xylan/chitin deacetylase (PgdA/CDA1 family)
MSPGGSRGRLSILIFHRVLREPDPLAPYEPDAAGFEARMRWVRGWFNVLPLVRAIDMLDGGTLPPRALSITFDDGYADNEELAAPILERLGMTATFFVSTGYIGGGTMWNDRIIEAVRACKSAVLDASAIGMGRFELATPAHRRDAIGAVLKGIKHLDRERRDAAVAAMVAAAGERADVPLMMQPEQVRRLRARGMDIGAHTVTHPILARLDEDDARHEIASSKSDLEHLLGERIELFAYPNGVPDDDYLAEHVAMVRECGFKAAVSTSWGAASACTDRFQLPRFTPWDHTRLRYGARLLRNLGRAERTAR